MSSVKGNDNDNNDNNNMYFIGLLEASIRKRILSSYYSIRHIVRAQQITIAIIIIITYFSFMTVYSPITEIEGIMLPHCQTKNQDVPDYSTKFGISHKISLLF